MGNNKKIIRNILFFLILIFLTFWFIFKKYDFVETIRLVFSVNYIFIILAFLCKFLDFLFESINLKNILSSLGKKIPLITSLRYTMIAFFFSGITPGGGGGQPMEIYYMNREGVKVTHGTIALLIEMVCYHSIAIILGLIGVVAMNHLMTPDFTHIFVLGLSLKALILAGMLIGLFSTKLSHKLVRAFIRLLTFIKIKNADSLSKRIENSLDEYSYSSTYIKTHKDIFLKSMILVFLQIIIYFSSTYFVYKSFGLTGYSYLEIVLIQALLYISTSSIPLPGAVGISESAFLRIFSSIFGASLLSSAMILERGATFYIYMLLTQFVVIYSTNKKKVIHE